MSVADTFLRNTKITRDDEHQRQQQRELDVVDRGLDGLRPVVQDLHVHGRGDLVVDARERGFDAVGDLDRVGARLPLHREHDRRLAVHPARGLVVLHVVGDPPDVAGVGPGRRCGTRRSCSRTRPRSAAGRWPATVSAMLGPHRMPVGMFTFWALTAVLTSSRSMPRGREQLRVELDAHRVLLLAIDQHLGHAARPSRGAARSSSRRTRRGSTAAATAT